MGSTRRSVAVFDTCPAYTLGLSAALRDAGFAVDEPKDLRAWAEKANGPRALIAGGGTEDEPLDPIAECSDLLAELPQLIAVALLSEPTPSAYAIALRSGASGAISRDASLAEIIEAVRAAFAGRVVLPAAIASALADRGLWKAAPRLAESEVEWVRALARGETVSSLAARAGYSERAMYRHLHAVYRCLGAESRTAAMVRAAECGLLLEPEDDGDPVMANGSAISLA